MPFFCQMTQNLFCGLAPALGLNLRRRTLNLAMASSRSDLNLLHTPPRFLRSLLASLAGLAVLVASSHADEGRVLRVPGSKLALTVAADLPEPVTDPSAGWELAEVGADSRIAVQVAPRVAADGTIAAPGGQLLAIIPPAQEAAAERQFRLERAAAGGPAASPFKLAAVDDKTLQVTDQDKPVLAYNYGTITGENVPENDGRRRRGCYLHPIWGLDGEILTDDFPKDHYHHHGASGLGRTSRWTGRNTTCGPTPASNSGSFAGCTRKPVRWRR